MSFLFAAKILSYSKFVYVDSVFQNVFQIVISQRRTLLRFIRVNRREVLQKTNVISIRRHDPHIERQWATCSALLHSTLTGYHVLSEVNYLQGPSLLSLPKVGIVIIPRVGLFLVRFPGRSIFSLLRTLHTVPGAQPAPFSVGTGDKFPFCKAAGT
jgi:hypothetical protein